MSIAVSAFDRHCSDLQEHRFPVALKPDIDAPDRALDRLCEQRRTPRRIGDRGQQRVGLVARVALEIGARDEPLQQTTRQDRQGDVGRLKRVAVSRSCYA
jgi:hypothetical protein